MSGDLTPLAEGAAQLHELFRAYVEAGFTEAQAIDLIARIVAYGQAGGAA